MGDIQLALNCTIQKTIRASPLKLFIGKVARPLTLLIMPNDDQDIDFSALREQAITSTQKAAVVKERFDRSKARIAKFGVGDFVLIQNHDRNQTKLQPKYGGPFKVLQALEGDRYLLSNMAGNRTYKYAHDHLRVMPDCPVVAGADFWADDSGNNDEQDTESRDGSVGDDNDSEFGRTLLEITHRA